TPPPAKALVFARPNGGPLNANTWRRACWEPAVKRSGVPYLSPHKLRHVWISRLISEGADLNYVKTMAGHTSITTTVNIYADVVDKDGPRKGVAQVDALLTAALSGGGPAAGLNGALPAPMKANGAVSERAVSTREI